jgi:hypothetical protein
MRYIMAFSLIFVVMLCGFTTCAPRHQKGGGATTDVRPSVAPATKPAEINLPENVNFVGGPDLHMGINQPENPEGISTMSSKQTTTTIYPDGVVVISNTETSSAIGGSQKLAEIMKEYFRSDYFKGLLFAMGLAIASWMSYRNKWPLAAGIFMAGAIASIMVTWWLGALSALAVATLYVGFKMGLPIPPEII